MEKLSKKRKIDFNKLNKKEQELLDDFFGN